MFIYKFFSNKIKFLFKNFNKFSEFLSYNWNLICANYKTFMYINTFVVTLVLPFTQKTSVFGFTILLAITSQLLSGFFLAWYYIPEPGLVIELREEMFEETRFGYEIFTLHVRGVDTIFVLSYHHILKKIYLKNYIIYDSDGWLLGGYAFFWFHYVVGLGICLSATHLSDLTLTIAANIYWSLLNNTHKTYYFIFTNKHLNADELMRLMILHYLSPWYYLYLVKLHLMFCHEGWDSSSEKGVYEDKSTNWISWFFDALFKEISDSWLVTSFVLIFFCFHYFLVEPTHYSFFEKWNVSEFDEMRFYGVAPHWYFRPLMGLLTIAPTHFEGVMWLVLYFILLAATPVFYSFYLTGIKDLKITPMKDSVVQTILFSIFLLTLFTTASILPCGRYYYDVEGGYVGNTILKWSYQYIYWYLGLILHMSDIIDNYVMKLKELVKEKMKKTIKYFLKKEIK